MAVNTTTFKLGMKRVVCLCIWCTVYTCVNEGRIAAFAESIADVCEAFTFLCASLSVRLLGGASSLASVLSCTVFNACALRVIDAACGAYTSESIAKRLGCVFAIGVG